MYSKQEARIELTSDTLVNIVTVPVGADRSFSIRPAARSTSGSQSSHAVIDLRCQSSRNSSMYSAVLIGRQPSEWEMK